MSTATAETDTEPREMFTVRYVAREIGVDATTLKRWIRLGLVPAPQRTKNGWRVWDTTALERLKIATTTLLRPGGRGVPSRHERILVNDEVVSITGPGGAER